MSAEHSPKTGIEVKMGYSHNVGVMGQIAWKAYHALHLDGLLLRLFAALPVIITIDDGEPIKVPSTHFLPEPHTYLIECAPGDHKISVAMGDAMGLMQGPKGTGLTYLLTRAQVEPGHITTVDYRQGMGGLNTFEVIGTRAG